MIKTHTPKTADVKHDWFVIDAAGQTLGRLATLLAERLQGKQRPDFAPHLDMADNLVVINAAKIKLTGNKAAQKVYYHHSGYPGGIKAVSFARQMEKDPTVVIEHAVLGMLPKNRLADVRMAHLKVYPGADHPHDPQKPAKLELARGRN